MRQYDDERRSPVERIVGRDLDEESGMGKPLSSRAAQTQRSIEAYLKGGVRPRWMERVAEIDEGIARERRALARAYRALRHECDGDTGLFAERWRGVARSWSFHDLNVLIEQHNDWYPIERQLPIDLRTRDYVLIRGRSYRRPELDAAWILSEFPPDR